MCPAAMYSDRQRKSIKLQNKSNILNFRDVTFAYYWVRTKNIGIIAYGEISMLIKRTNRQAVLFSKNEEYDKKKK